MAIRLAKGLLGQRAANPAGLAVRRARAARRTPGTMWTVAAALVVLGLLAATRPAAAASLADLLRAGDPALLIDGLAKLGRTLDLSEPHHVGWAIGDVQGATVQRDQRRESWEPAFTRYSFPNGEITYNPDLGSQYYLLVRINTCVPVQVIRERLQGPEFRQPASRITVAIYTDAPYKDRHLNAFSYLEMNPDCVSSFGLSQWKYDPWRNP